MEHHVLIMVLAVILNGKVLLLMSISRGSANMTVLSVVSMVVFISMVVLSVPIFRFGQATKYMIRNIIRMAFTRVS